MLDYEVSDDGDNIIRAPDLNYDPNPKGLGHELFDMMKKQENVVGQIDAITGKQDTLGDLLNRCVRTAIEMKSRGVTCDDIIALCSYNHLNSCVPYIATLFLGAKVACLDPTISLQDTKHLLKQVHPRMIFVVPESKELIKHAVEDLCLKSDIVVFGNTSEFSSFDDFLQPSPLEEEFTPASINSVFDTAVIFFSSGTTGLPKGICTSHFTLLSQSANFILSGFDSTVTLAFASLYWISAALVLIQNILAGTCRILCRSFEARKAWYYIDKYKVTFMFLAPAQATAMLKQERMDGLDTSSLLDVVIGGGPFSSENMVALRDLLPGTNVCLGYGQTEVSGVITAFKPKLRRDVILMHKKPGSCGRPMMGFWYKIVDLETEEIKGPNERGELRIKSMFEMNGYHNLDCSDVWDSQGWLRTGDICYYDEDHCFYVVDRIKEMLKFQSWHIPPALIEGILHQHPAVETAVVIGVPHEEDGDHPMAVVVLSQKANGITPGDLITFVAARVDDRQRLRGGVRFIKEIPTTPTGKIKRKELREKILLERA